ncbi:ABC transporter permease [Biformimicrobium ophioploci]|uniref:ABC transporter permease n=1 Tax=Biformimicrobium ophioploci TaxID=3036711 RepID=A0ABQ6LZ63_9GAMM|nr:FtsX-like permease family protein [Microbulbifer sp. NKW57]GMG87327.1 ABC transporter permease [Microbulbifer sp. NKW57]
MLELKPMLSALWRNKTSAFLIALQLALTLAIVSNAGVIVSERVEKIARPTGMQVEDLISVTFMPIAQEYDMAGAVAADMDLLRGLPGVVDAFPTNQIPVSGSGSASRYFSEPNQEIGGEVANYYQVDPNFINTLGLELVAGRNFTAAEMDVMGPNENYDARVAIITRDFGEALFPGEEPLGKFFFPLGENNPIEIVGVIDRHLGAWVGWQKAGQVVFYPLLIKTNHKRYMIRAEPGQRDAVMKLVEEKLAQRDANRVLQLETLSRDLEQSYMSDNVMVKVLSAVIALLTFIVSLGIVGLTIFWINQRRKQIGIRRALGATRANISRYFLLENGLIAALGIAMGFAIAMLINRMMVTSFSQPAMPAGLLLSCAALLLLASLGAALVPALRAANISPATATRSV